MKPYNLRGTLIRRGDTVYNLYLLDVRRYIESGGDPRFAPCVETRTVLATREDSISCGKSALKPGQYAWARKPDLYFADKDEAYAALAKWMDTELGSRIAIQLESATKNRDTLIREAAAATLEVERIEKLKAFLEGARDKVNVVRGQVEA